MENERLQIDPGLLKRAKTHLSDSKNWHEYMPEFLRADIETITGIFQYFQYKRQLHDQFKTIYNYCLDDQMYTTACHEIFQAGFHKYHERIREQVKRVVERWPRSNVVDNSTIPKDVGQIEAKRKARTMLFQFEEFKG